MSAERTRAEDHGRDEFRVHGAVVAGPGLRVRRDDVRVHRAERRLPAHVQKRAQADLGKVAVRQFAQRGVKKLVRIAPVGQRVLVAPAAFQRAGVGQQQSRLPQQVERDIGQRDVRLQVVQFL